MAAVAPRDLSDTFSVQRMLSLSHKYLQEDTKPAALRRGSPQHPHPHPSTRIPTPAQARWLGAPKPQKPKPLGTAVPQPDTFSLTAQASKVPGDTQNNHPMPRIPKGTRLQPQPPCDTRGTAGSPGTLRVCPGHPVRQGDEPRRRHLPEKFLVASMVVRMAP